LPFEEGIDKDGKFVIIYTLHTFIENFMERSMENYTDYLIYATLRKYNAQREGKI